MAVEMPLRLVRKIKDENFRIRAFRRFLPPHIILLISILTTMLATYYVAMTVEENDQIRFENEIQETEENIDKRLDAYIALLRGTAGLFAASEFVTKEEFKSFVERLRLDQNYPGIQGLGYAPKITAGNFEPHLFATQLENPAYRIYPFGEREIYFPIVYLEPENDRNKTALGFDMYSDEARKSAMIKSQDTGRRAATGKVTLVQEIGPEKQAGFLIYLPIYANKQVPDTVEERRKEIIGFVYAPFRTDDLLKGIFGDNSQNLVNYKIYDGTEINPASLLHESTISASNTPRFAQSIQLDVAGRIWTIYFTTKPEFERSSNWNFVPLTLILGTFLSFLFYFISRSQAQAFTKAQKAAENLQHSQEKLKQSEMRYRLVVENTNDIISLLDQTGNIIYASPSFKRVLGYLPKELIGKSAFNIIHPEDVEKTKHQMLEALKGKMVGATFRLKNKQGKYLYFEGNGTAIFDRKGNPEMLVSTSHDITERTELERRKDEFISMASHELKTPVTSLKVFTQVAQTLISKKENKKAGTFLVKMDDQINKLTRLISELLNLSRIQSGKLELNMEEFKMDDLVADIVESLNATTATHKIIFKGKTKVNILGDRDRIGQILINLITNAVKYSPRADKVLVNVSKSRNEVIVAVRDYGIGIPTEHLGKIFDRFYQVSEGPDGTYPGLGIGLYISSEIARRHKGKITVESKKGIGSIFSLRLPLKAQTFK